MTVSAVARGLALVAAVGFLHQAPPGYGGAAWAMDAKQVTALRVNIAGRQRLLSQRVLASACLSARGIDAERQARVLTEAGASFVSALDRLENGSVADGLPPMEDQITLVTLGTQRSAWTGLSAAVLQAEGGDAAALAQLPTAAAEVLRTALSTVQSMALTGTTGEQELARYVDLAGRQRMLSQRMVANSCLVSAGIGGAELQQRIADDVAEFDANLGRLAEGDPATGIVAAPSLHMLMALDALAPWWQPVRAAALQAASGTLDPAALEAMAAGYETLLERLEETVWLAGEM
ncbi:type IV pili methyl-accepting chemotaxis transducer N-terminal domain-containing protein [Frigidibacter sp. MR17.24]|uniref:type IV pili methyl-accepting chemotaxis transducer N-terminal domain-containing protein n=1 Tax=Frigidibacter sp. MR17.24 TaxID=3127345 RepID=UPI003012B4B7